MPYVKVCYSKVDDIVSNLDLLSKTLDSEISSYESLIRNIANYPEWKGIEKGRILECAASSYYDYFNAVKENVDSLKSQIDNKKEEYLNAEK